MVRADFVAGLVFVGLGVGAFVFSLEMPRFEERNINPYTIPGLVPGALGLIIALLGAVLAGRAARAGGWRAGPFGIAADRALVRRVGLTLVLTLGYAGGLVGRVPFWLGTFLFVAGFVVLFEWAGAPERRVRRIAFALIYAALVAAIVTYVFQEIFLVRLP